MQRMTFRPIILGVVGIALLCTFFLPAMRLTVMALFMGSGTVDVSLVDTVKALHEDGMTWVAIVAAIGALIAVGGVLSYDDGDPEATKWTITLGTLLALVLPGRLLLLLNEASEEAAAEGAVFPGSLGTGLIIASIGLIAATGCAWYASAQAQPAPATPSSYNSGMHTTMRPTWMPPDSPGDTRRDGPDR